MTSATTHIALLHETRQNRPCQIHDVAASARACRSMVKQSLVMLQDTGALTLKDETILINREERIRIAELAIGAGADPEKVARELRWQEFESLANQILTRDGFSTLNHLVFRAEGRRYEIDVVGAKEPVVLCVDCKHWHHGWAPSKITAAARNQMLRVLSLSRVLPMYSGRLRIGNWRTVRLIPVVLTLADLSSRLVEGVPVVSALRLRSFLSELSPWVSEVRFVDAGIPSLSLLPWVTRESRTASSTPALLSAFVSESCLPASSGATS